MKDSDRSYLLGSTESGDPALFLGRYLALDGSAGAPVLLDIGKPHAVVICGKRGYGKSYTLGVLLEEFANLSAGVRKNFAVIVVDTMGIFGGLAGEKGIGARVFAPAPFLKDLPRGTLPFELPTGSLSAYDYCELLGIDPLSPHGAVLAGAISACGPFSIESLIADVSTSETSPEVKSTVCGLLSMVSAWQLFSREASFAPLLEPGSLNVVDLSGYGHDPGIKACAVASLARALYDLRVRERRREAEAGSREVPLIWLLIDEAHMFLQAGSGVGRVLVNEWLRQGRQPGLSLVLATQRPSAFGYDVLSQADVIVCHRLTLRDDVEALERARPLYVREPVREAMARLGTLRGAAIVLDDATESYHVVRVRQRKTKHGGGEPELYGDR